MKKLIFILLAISVLTLSMSCEEELIPRDPEVRAYLQPGYNSIWACLATVNSGYFTAETDWIYLVAGTYSEYYDVEEGYYYVFYDDDYDHSYADYASYNLYEFEDNKRYTVSFINDVIIITED